MKLIVVTLSKVPPHTMRRHCVYIYEAVSPLYRSKGSDRIFCIHTHSQRFPEAVPEYD